MIAPVGASGIDYRLNPGDDSIPVVRMEVVAPPLDFRVDLVLAVSENRFYSVVPDERVFSADRVYRRLTFRHLSLEA